MMKNNRHPHMLTASEVGEYVFCAKAWKLKRQGIQPRSSRLKEGTAHHVSHQTGVYWSRRLRAWGRLLIALLITGLIVWLLARLKLWP